jgi:hypothetical protein
MSLVLGPYGHGRDTRCTFLRAAVVSSCPAGDGDVGRRPEMHIEATANRSSFANPDYPDLGTGSELNDSQLVSRREV